MTPLASHRSGGNDRGAKIVFSRIEDMMAQAQIENVGVFRCLPDTSDNMTPMQVGFHHLAVRIGYGALIVRS